MSELLFKPYRVIVTFKPRKLGEPSACACFRVHAIPRIGESVCYPTKGITQPVKVLDVQHQFDAAWVEILLENHWNGETSRRLCENNYDGIWTDASKFEPPIFPIDWETK